jgi:hypothetical protein
MQRSRAQDILFLVGFALVIYYYGTNHKKCFVERTNRLTVMIYLFNQWDLGFG